MNGFQIGNKRLKVQHKRVHGAKTNPQVQSDEPSDESAADGSGEPQGAAAPES
jgi:hypothetical protein